MPRYIDADALKERLDIVSVEADSLYKMGINSGLDRANREINSLPTADVAPKSEVERLERICHSYALQYGTVTDQQKVIDKAKAEGAIEVIEYLESNGLLNMIPQGIAELKKKYTGGDE